MKKTDWQYLVDTLLFLCIVGIIFIGFLMGLVLPKGPTALESEKYFLGLHRHDWGNIHFYLSIAFTVLVVIHLILSWKWIKAKSRQLFKKGWSTMLALIAAASVLVLLLFWTFYPRVPGAYEEYGIGAGKKQGQNRLLKEGYSASGENILLEDGTIGIVITGKTTLREIEKVTGIPAKDIAAELGLPKKISPKETLGRLRKKYLFSLQEARDAINKLLAGTTAPRKAKSETQEEKIEKKKDVPEKQKKEEEHEEKLTRGRKAEDTSAILITGRMTLIDIEKKTGVSSRKIAEKLGLPESVSPSETLGRLRKRYLFTMQDVRDAVASLIKKK